MTKKEQIKGVIGLNLKSLKEKMEKLSSGEKEFYNSVIEECGGNCKYIGLVFGKK